MFTLKNDFHDTTKPIKQFPADWDTHGRSAGYKRNIQMGHYGTHLLAFWDGKSKGTGSMIDIALRYGLWVKVIYFGKHKLHLN